MSKNKPAKTKTESRELDCILTPDELRDRAGTLAHTIQDKSGILEEKKEANSGFKARLDACDKVIIQSSNAINNGKETRDVECEVTLNTPSNGIKTITRTDTGETWQEDMTMLEMQEEIEFDK